MGGAFAWVALLVVTGAPTIGLVAPVYPDPNTGVKATLMLAAGVFTACVLAFIGVRLWRGEDVEKGDRGGVVDGETE